MTHFGIICPALPGHLYPMSTLGYELIRRNHRVTFFGILDIQARTVESGFGFYALGLNQFPLGSLATISERLGNLKGVAALQYSIEVVVKVTELLLQELPSAIQATNVNALLIDQTTFGANTVANHLGIPYITIANALMLNSEIDIPPYITTWAYNPTWWTRLRNWTIYYLINQASQPIKKTVSKYCQLWNLPNLTKIEDNFSPLAQISQQPCEFEFPRPRLIKNFYFTGPFHDSASRIAIEFPYSKLTGQTIIYASLGTLQNRLRNIFYIIAKACENLDVQLVITLGGGSSIDEFLDLPGSPIVVEYAPQLELLKRASLTITHAGMNTTLESLSEGVPMVAIPIAHDQPGVARRIQWTGVGELISLNQLNSERLQQAIKRVLSDVKYKNSAAKFQEKIKQCNGVYKAADIIDQVISSYYHSEYSRMGQKD